MEAGGANIVIANPGTYYIILDLSSNTYSIQSFQGDKRGMFHSDGQNLEIESIPPFEDGYAVKKFKNIGTIMSHSVTIWRNVNIVSFFAPGNGTYL